MDINPQSAKPISDDQELAKVLAGVNQQNDEPLQFDIPPVVAPVAPPPAAPTTDPVTPPAVEEPVADESAESTLPTPTISPVVGYNPPIATATAVQTLSAPSEDLSEIKQDALNDLRPLVDKLDIAPEEKFDTYLLLIRSTDDKTLIAPAYAAAQAIADESRKAQALLDVIKEIDYLSKPE